MRGKDSLEWIQLNSSGADAYAVRGAVPEGSVLTLSACKKGSYLMNVGRGNVIDTKALRDKEIYEHFAGIWLDVCETEPLADNDPLYYVPGLQ